MEQEDIDEGLKNPVLGPHYFAARRIAEQTMAKFEAEHFRPMVEQFVAEFRDALWPQFEDNLLFDTEMNLQGTIWRQVDGSVQALLSGEKWALERYALGSRYDQQKVREAIAAHIPAELQNARIADLEAELAETKRALEIERRSRSPF